MKNTILVFALLLVIYSCSPTTSTEQSTDSTQVASEPTGPTPVTVCTWNELNVRETPSEKGKYITSIYLNEPVTLTGDTASEKSGNKRLKYHKVTLSDGKSGWVRDEFIAIDVFPAAIKDEVVINKRPDISTVTEKKFYTADYVVARESSPGWYEVTGKPVGEKWFVSGYVQSEHLLLEPVDVQYAALSRRAAEAIKSEMITVLRGQLEDQSMFGSSYFFASMTEPDEEGESDGGEQDYVTGKLFFYLFEGNSEDVYSSYTGQVNGATLTHGPNGNKESAYHFDGDDYIGVPAAVRLAQIGFTIGVLFKAEDMQSPGQTLVSQGRSADGTGFALAFQGGSVNGTITMGFVGESPKVLFVPLKKPANANWHFVVATYDGRTVKMYINSELVDEMTIDDSNAEIIESNLLNTDMPIEIGRELESLDRYFKGTIDQAFMYNRVFGVEEVRQMSEQSF